MRQLHFFVLMMLLALSACKKPADPAPATDMSLEMELSDEEMMIGPESMISENLPPVKSPDGHPIVMDVVDDSANPLHAPRILTPEEAASGWISLFDGKTLFGWKSNNPDVQWKVEDGAITADVGPVGLLLTTVPFADYELVCEFQYSADANSGLFLRTTENPVKLDEDCLELNIADEQPEGYVTGSLVNRMKSQIAVPASRDWQTYHVTAIGNRVLVELNGDLVQEYKDESPLSRKSGLIGLQQRFGKVQFRKINLKPLAMKSLFNGSNLSGWRQVPESKATFQVEFDAIHVKGGPGFLETVETYQDFIFQTAVRTGTRGVNSGFFFRAEPGTEKAPSNGYEVQVHNGFKGTDRDLPDNSGSGAIFRRNVARRVVSNDLEWATITLVAKGPQFSTWVDGYQVVDWIDDRPADPNPRKGLRLDGGHISLQGHDPGTDAEFRALRIHKLSDSPAQ